MKRTACVLLFVFFLAFALEARNLTFVRTINPINYELIDVEVDGDWMIIPAGLGGAELYDLSDPRQPKSVGSMDLRRCRWGRSYNWDIEGTLAIGTARECGFAVYDISTPSDPTLLEHRVADNDFDGVGREVSLEDVEIVGNLAIFAAHGSGLVFYDISVPSSPRFIRYFETQNAWSLAVHDNFVFVADGEDGIKIIRIDNPLSPQLRGSAPTSGAAQDIQYRDGELFVAVGTAGVDVFDVSSPANPTLLANYETSGFTSRVAVHNDLVSLSSWDQLHVLRWQKPNLELVGYKNTGGRLMAVGSPGGNIIYAAEWEELHVYEFGPVESSDIDASTRVLDFGEVAFDEQATLQLTLENNGDSPLQVQDIAFTYDDFDTPSKSFTIAPHSEKTIDVIYTPTRLFVGGNMIVFSNDPDEPQIYIETRGNNSDEVQPGDIADNFELPVLVNGSGTLSLEELRGRVVVLAIFASW